MSSERSDKSRECIHSFKSTIHCLKSRGYSPHQGCVQTAGVWASPPRGEASGPSWWSHQPLDSASRPQWGGAAPGCERWYTCVAVRNGLGLTWPICLCMAPVRQRGETRGEHKNVSTSLPWGLQAEARVGEVLNLRDVCFSLMFPIPNYSQNVRRYHSKKHFLFLLNHQVYSTWAFMTRTFQTDVVWVFTLK